MLDDPIVHEITAVSELKVKGEKDLPKTSSEPAHVTKCNEYWA